MIKKYVAEFDEPKCDVEYELSELETKLANSKIFTRALVLLLSVSLIFLIMVVFQTRDEVRTLSQNLAKPTRAYTSQADDIRAIQNKMDVINDKADVIVGYVRP